MFAISENRDSQSKAFIRALYEVSLARAGQLSDLEVLGSIDSFEANRFYEHVTKLGASARMADLRCGMLKRMYSGDLEVPLSIAPSEASEVALFLEALDNASRAEALREKITWTAPATRNLRKVMRVELRLKFNVAQGSGGDICINETRRGKLISTTVRVGDRRVLVQYASEVRSAKTGMRLAENVHALSTRGVSPRCIWDGHSRGDAAFVVASVNRAIRSDLELIDSVEL